MIRWVKPRPHGTPTKEGLHLNSTVSSCVAVAQDNVLDVDDTLAIDKQLHLAICLPDVVELDTLRHGGPLALGERECSPTDRCTVRGIAIGLWRNVAHMVVCVNVETGGEVGIDLALATRAPHETHRVALWGAPTAGTADSNIIVVAAVQPG